MRFRPTFWATALALPVLIVLIGLGTWQVQRLQWKNELIATRAERVGALPVEITEALAAAGDLADVEYRPVTVSGELRNDRAMILLNRVHNGQVGGHLIAPMELANGLGTVMVDRGWMSLPDLRAFAAAGGESVTLDGFVRMYTAPGGFVPENEPATNNWFFMHEGEMLAAAGLSGPVGFYVQAGPKATPPGVYPMGAVPDVNLRNSHLEYAVTWYALAAVFLVIFFIFHWNRKDT
ncbi:MAG: SURF1 family protein [Alphaproteobacteria bacterium]